MTNLTVTNDEIITDFTGDCIVFLGEENGDIKMLYNADAIAMGQAAKMAAKAFLKMWEDTDYATRAELMSILGPDFEKGVWQINHE